MALSESLKTEALRVLDSTECICGSGKDRHKSFCRACYFSLPKSIQLALIMSLGFQEGYASILAEACDWLAANTTRLRRPPA